MKKNVIIIYHKRHISSDYHEDGIQTKLNVLKHCSRDILSIHLYSREPLE